MKSKSILCVTLSAIFWLFARPSIAAPPASVPPAAPSKTDWQASLRAAITDDGSLPPVGSKEIIQLTIPAAAGQILESRPKTELLPFLTKLRAEPPAWKAGIIDIWIFIVHNGLHGTRMTITNSIAIPGGRSVFQKAIPVYCYTCRYPAPPTNAAPGRPAPSKKK